jgi:ABC-type dipeptide/oligopeptide/nickel transport system permease subunit
MPDTDEGLGPREVREAMIQRVEMTEQGAHEIESPLPEGAVDIEGMATNTRGQWSTVLHRFLHHGQAMTGVTIFVLVMAVSFIYGLFNPGKYSALSTDLNQSPSMHHLFGTNSIGQDILAQVLKGTLQDVQVAVLVAVMAVFIGTIIGSLSGFYGGKVYQLLMRFVDLILVIPVLVVLILLAHIVATKANNWFYLAIIIGSLSWTYIARLVRADFLSLRERDFIEASRALGASDLRIITRHMIPNAIGPIIVNATITIAGAIVLEATLSYLGLGIQPPGISLGLLIEQGQNSATTQYWLFVFPATFLLLLILSVFFIGDGLQAALDPKKNRARA